MKSILSKFDVFAVFCLRSSLVLLAVTLTSLLAVAVFLRYVLGQSIPAIEELSILIGVWFYFLAFTLVTRERVHLTGGILNLINITPRQLQFIKFFNDVIGLVVVSIFAYYAFKYLFFVMKINRTSTNLSWPTALWVSAAVLGFIMMSIYKIRDLFNHSNTHNPLDYRSPHPKGSKTTKPKM